MRKLVCAHALFPMHVLPRSLPAHRQGEPSSHSDVQSYCGCGRVLSPVGSENHTLFFHHTTPPWAILPWFRTLWCRKFTRVLADSFLPVCVYSASCIACLQSLLEVKFWKISCYYRATVLVSLGYFFLSIFMTLESFYMLFASICPYMKWI